MSLDRSSISRRSLLAGAALLLSACSEGTGAARTDSAASSPDGLAAKAPVTITNVSYDPTRELYKEFNSAFADHWQEEQGQKVTVNMSHGGSGKQARTVIDGLRADVVTLALSVDIDKISELAGVLPTDWQSRLPNASSPYTSTIVFLVRDGNPKSIEDWDDLTREGIQVITPNPKTSGGARWNYLAAWAYAEDAFSGDDEQVKQFISGIYRNVPVLDTGARGSTITFTQRGIGDVLLAWENEAFLALDELGEDAFDIIVPSLSIKALPPVALVDENATANGTTEVAKAYLEYLYSDVGQKLAAKHYYRPFKPEAADPEDLERFPEVKLVTVEDEFGGWPAAQERHFADGGVFDQIYVPGQ